MCARPHMFKVTCMYQCWLLLHDSVEDSRTGSSKYGFGHRQNVTWKMSLSKCLCSSMCLPACWLMGTDSHIPSQHTVTRCLPSRYKLGLLNCHRVCQCTVVWTQWLSVSNSHDAASIGRETQHLASSNPHTWMHFKYYICFSSWTVFLFTSILTY